MRLAMIGEGNATGDEAMFYVSCGFKDLDPEFSWQLWKPGKWLKRHIEAIAIASG